METIVTKVCYTCKRTKDAGAFSKNIASKDGLQATCRRCRDILNERKKVYRSKNVDKMKNEKLKYRYHITIEKYNEMLKDQKGVCAICGGTNQSEKALAVDHDHACCPGERSCGECVRGLLCEACNLSIGRMQDDPIRLIKASEYILEFRQS